MSNALDMSKKVANVYALFRSDNCILLVRIIRLSIQER